MSFSFGERIKISVFGQSHSEMMGVVIDGLPAGFKIDEEKLSAFMARRAPGRDGFSTPRREKDEVNFVSGTVDGRTCGAPLCAVIENTNTRSKDYENLKSIPRPSHADFAAYMKYGSARDVRGGGEFSGRLTAPLCVAGGILNQFYEEAGIFIGSHIASVGNTDDDRFDPVAVTQKDFPVHKTFPVLNDEKGSLMQREILNAREDGDSVGGVVECAICGLSPAVGDTFFDSLEGRISRVVFSVPAVKGIEFGSGFFGSRLRGSENNDGFYAADGTVKTYTNNHGGILGGISSGMPIIFRAAFKPTPSIFKTQKSVDLKTLQNTQLSIKGRHDPCIVRRGAVCIEAAAAVALADLILRR